MPEIQNKFLRLHDLRILPGSLKSDPERPSVYYLAADRVRNGRAEPVLLEFAPPGIASPERFSNPLASECLAGDPDGPLSVRVFPFSSTDYDSIRRFAQQVEPACLPRPQGALPAIAAGNRHPEISLPAVFYAFRTILYRSGTNWASTVQLSATREMTTEAALASRDGENPVAAGHTRVSIRHLYHAGLWAAIRAGWRAGYNAEADHFIVSGSTAAEIARSVEMVKEAIRQASGYTKFTTDTSRLFALQADPRHPAPWEDAAVAERFSRILTPEEQRWVMAEFGRPFQIDDYRYEFTPPELRRLAVKFGESLKLNEELFDSIRAAKVGGLFDFEPSLDEAETLTTPKELLFCMQWLKARGRPAQLVPPNLGFKKRQAYPETVETGVDGAVGLSEYCRHKMWPELAPRVMGEFGGRPLDELGARVSKLAAVARFFDGTLSIHSGSGKQAEVLQRIGRATRGRVNYKISGELQLQLLDVLSEQPAGSSWRQLFERMAARTNDFAAQGVFGAESELAEQYMKKGRGYSLGDPARGRVDGNLFLVFWIGNLVGSRDREAPDGDQRFFKEKLEELPEALLAEVRRRNAAYVVWLAENLRGETGPAGGR